MNNRKDDQLREKLIKVGIIDGLIKIFSSWDINMITDSIVESFFNFTYPCSFPKSQLLIEKKPFPSLFRLFNHKDKIVVSHAIFAIDNILYAGAIGTDSISSHPYYDDLQQSGGIEKIFQLFKRSQKEYTKDVSAICLGIIFRAREMTVLEMKVKIISHLKSITNHSREEIRIEVELALNCLSQNSGLFLAIQQF
ncbi:MAG: hypothetical protein EZS28_020273 [Streblomastix strix]|uniref:Uncharacterized protein n=1 Tax=Streblomastix strix TaxID=222440 RepID=A0A5J4VPF4_9EUKA|nr:MAG: hypothetical protein EZS28_020273 [Streblomastix strix]